MRSTQYIGLTNYALEFVSKFCTKVESHRSTFGMVGELVPLGEWEFMGLRIKEVVQASPWSSGPMIFTQLEVDHGDRKEKPKQFSWKETPFGGWEFDRETGKFWV